jgi:hypothetical protein
MHQSALASVRPLSTHFLHSWPLAHTLPVARTARVGLRACALPQDHPPAHGSRARSLLVSEHLLLRTDIRALAERPAARARRRCACAPELLPWCRRRAERKLACQSAERAWRRRAWEGEGPMPVPPLRGGLRRDQPRRKRPTRASGVQEEEVRAPYWAGTHGQDQRTSKLHFCGLRGTMVVKPDAASSHRSGSTVTCAVSTTRSSGNSRSSWRTRPGIST